MEGIHAYLLSVVAAAIISTVLINLLGSKSAYSGIIRLLTGIFLSITVVAPLAKITLSDVSAYITTLDVDSDTVIRDGTNSAREAMAEIIKGNTEAYILDKAANIGLTIEVTVYLSDDIPPVPKSVAITGSAAPYAKKQLLEIIERDLAISKENQTWT